MRGGAARLAIALAGSALLTGCVGIPHPNAPLPIARNAIEAGVRAGPPVSSLPFGPRNAADALYSFRQSCPKLLLRDDTSRLTTSADWRVACAAAGTWSPLSAKVFFERYFETARIGDGKAFATGYYEPQIRGSRTHIPGYDVPVYGVPADLVRAWPANIPEDQRTGRPPLGRYDEDGQFVPYYTREQIEAGALAGKGLEIAWVADPVELFFLQIQGSGRLVAPDGSILRIGYAGQNGREYVSIGAAMRKQGLIGDGPGQYPPSMQGIMAYIREHPAEGKALMDLNKSWIFFKEVTGAGPIGAMGVPVKREVSIATDPAFVPLGAPVWLRTDRPIADGLWIAQDTGGAIKGTNRFDTFWGAGEEARLIAGGMSGHGRALVFLPRGTLARLHRK